MKIFAGGPDDGWLDQAVRIESPHQGGRIEPELIVNHWTAGGSAANSVAALELQGLSAHFIVGRDGSIFQTVSCNRLAHHAGPSRWGGRGRCNSFAIGIEWCNYGPLWRDRDGRLRTVYGSLYHGAEPALGRVPGVLVDTDRGRETAQLFEPFTPEQIDTGADLHAALLERYPAIQAAVDHATVSPGRKVDILHPASPVAGWHELIAGVDAIPAKARELEGEPDDMAIATVAQVQAALNRHGADPQLVVDGIVGWKTSLAVWSFQQKRGLKVDGIAGPKTRAALAGPVLPRAA